MNFRSTMIALLLTALAVAVPCAAWYITGSREMMKETKLLQKEPRQKAEQAAEVLAQRVASDLDRLRKGEGSEGSRPFYHYQTLYHDPKGASVGAFIVSSPLVQIPGNPLIRAYFQIDATGRVMLPSLSEQIVDARPMDFLTTQRQIQKELEISASACVDFAKGVTVALTNQIAQVGSYQKAFQSGFRGQVEFLDREAWEQNIQAGKLYEGMKRRRIMAPTPDLNSRSNGTNEKVTIVVSPFNWHTISLGDSRALVALRGVTTPRGILTQGFVISSSAVEDSLKGAAFPARFVVGKVNEPQIAIPVKGTGWLVTVDPSQALAEADRRAQEMKAAFRQTFFWGVVAAGVAGCCVVGLVWQVERLARQRSQFAASAAHELKTPLASLRMYGEMLADGLGDPSRAKDYARRIADEAERLGRVVTNVLGFTHLEHGSFSVRAESGDLSATIRECLERQRTSIETSGAKMDLSISDDLPRVRFDRDAVFQIVQNLIDNAEKYSRFAMDRTIHVALAKTNGGVGLSVTDHGPGVPPSIRRSVFRPFRRGNNRNDPNGLGLGLSLAQSLAREQGAEITYRDHPTGGAVFLVMFHS